MPPPVTILILNVHQLHCRAIEIWYADAAFLYDKNGCLSKDCTGDHDLLSVD